MVIIIIIITRPTKILNQKEKDDRNKPTGEADIGVRRH